MTHLIPTPIVDSRGRSTTVHKRPEGTSAGSRSLASVKPVLKPTKAASVMDEQVSIAGGTRLSENSIIMQNSGYFESDWIQYGRGEYSWRDDDFDMPSDKMYEYLKFGIDPVEASVFHQMRIGSEWFEPGKELCDRVPGSIGFLGKSHGTRSVSEITELVDILKEANVPVETAAKVITNGLSRWNVKHSDLNLEQLCELFGKWKYDGSSTAPTHTMIASITRGEIPFELIRTNSRAELVRYSEELSQYGKKADLEKLRNSDAELYLRVASKGVKSVKSKDPVTDMYNLVDEFGEGVLALKYPKMARSGRTIGGKEYGIEGATYIESVQKLLTKSKNKSVGDWRVYYEVGYDDYRSSLKSLDFIEMMDAGATPEQAVDLIVDRELSVIQALSVLQDGTPVSLAEGAL